MNNPYDISCQQEAYLLYEYERHWIDNGYCPKCRGDLETVTVTETVEPFTFLRCLDCGWEDA